MWQTIRRPTLRERSKSYITTALYVAFFVFWIVGAFYFKFNDYNTVGSSKVRDQVIANYTKILYENQQVSQFYQGGILSQRS
ncbi:unnamed protein product [Cylicocyclus nassatus]|uniref:Uncharacterized protein n=1 Tax=Cylicocyclus nassatus TaxID=53992 RepID=A0AA36GTY5_CYLNA|nr:unnamed protein product [Cylicocyclus nassatus]